MLRQSSYDQGKLQDKCQKSKNTFFKKYQDSTNSFDENKNASIAVRQM